MIMRAVKIDQCIANIFQDRQCRRRTVDELAIAAGRRKTSLNNKIVRARFDPGFDQLGVQLLQFFAGKNGFRGASVGAGANERFIGTFAE